MHVIIVYHLKSKTHSCHTKTSQTSWLGRDILEKESNFPWFRLCFIFVFGIFGKSESVAYLFYLKSFPPSSSRCSSNAIKVF